MCYDIVKNALSANSPTAVKRTNSAMSMYIQTINYMSKKWDAVTDKMFKQRFKDILGTLLGKSFH